MLYKLFLRNIYCFIYNLDQKLNKTIQIFIQGSFNRDPQQQQQQKTILKLMGVMS